MALKVLALGGYDIIMGMDWLEQHSPMTVHRRKKILTFLYQGKWVVLCGLKEEFPSREPKTIPTKQLSPKDRVQLCSIQSSD